MADQSHKRHIAKTITWRLVGTIDTILLSWIISSNALTGLQIGFFEVITEFETNQYSVVGIGGEGAVRVVMITFLLALPCCQL